MNKYIYYEGKTQDILNYLVMTTTQELGLVTLVMEFNGDIKYEVQTKSDNYYVTKNENISELGIRSVERKVVADNE